MSDTTEVVRTEGVRAVSLPGASHVSIGLSVPTGFALDPAGAAGAAHLCEHAVLAAVPRRLMGSMPVAAVTGCHRTTFVADVPPEELDTALEVFRAIARPDPARLETAVHHERPVVALELSMGAGAAGRGLGAAVADRFVPGTGLGRELDATPGTVGAVPYEKVLACVETYYRPQAATLVLAGPVRPAQLAGAVAFFSGDDGPLPAAVPPAAAGTEKEVAPAWGVAYAYAARHFDPRPAWQDCLDEALTRPASPADRFAKELGGTAFGAAVLRCPQGDVVMSAYRSQDPGSDGRAAASRLRGAMVSEEGLQKIVSAAVQAAGLGYAARRSRMGLPWHARDALLAEATGTGPLWEQWSAPYDRARAAEAATALLTRTDIWHT